MTKEPCGSLREESFRRGRWRAQEKAGHANRGERGVAAGGRAGGGK